MSKLQVAPFAHRRSVNLRRRRRGAQTLVETAMCLAFILLPMVFAGLQFAIIINANHALEELAREGGRFAAVHWGESTFDKNETQTNPPSLDAYIQQVSRNTSIRYADITSISVDKTPSQRSSGDWITVTIVYPMSKKMIFIPASWNKMQYGGGNSPYNYGTYMTTLAKDRTVASTFLME